MELLEMRREIDYKVPEGKLIRLDLEIHDEVIKDISITGDFFIYPENKIKQIQTCLKDIKLSDIKNVLEDCIKKNNITLIGFKADDVETAIRNC